MIKSKIMIAAKNHPITLKHTKNLLLEVSLNQKIPWDKSLCSTIQYSLVSLMINIKLTAGNIYESFLQAKNCIRHSTHTPSH